MNQSIATLAARFEGRKSLVLLAGLGAITIATIGIAYALPFGLPPAVIAVQPNTGTGTPQSAHAALPSGVRLNGTLSQTKLVQGDNGAVYLSVSVTTPQLPVAVAHQATDTIVILDHSGSMSAENRLPYAKKAIHDLVDRMSENDRFALVVFDSSAQIVSPLTAVSSGNKSSLHATIDSITPGSGTNMSAGITLARSILSGRETERMHKVILMSDGEANEGITDPRALSGMVSSVNKESASVSTIGMGLGFNETLMASLADWGGGTFSYLEHLDKLAEILNRNLDDARQMFASSSTIELTLPAGVSIVDAAGYPLERNTGVISIPTGQLLSGSDKRLTLSLQVPTSSVGNIDLGGITFRYGNGSDLQRLELPKSSLALAVVEPERRDEAFASIDKDAYQKTWSSNNYGVFKRKVQGYLSKGDVAGAKSAMTSYSNDLKSAETALNAPIGDSRFKEELRQAENEINDAEKGSSYEQKDKQNKLAKKYLTDGLAAQRSR